MSTGAGLYGTNLPVKKKRRGGGGCCGCFFLVLAVLVGLFFAARKWAPNRLVQAEGWARQRAVEKYPILDRWIPTVVKPTMPVAPTPVSASPTPSAVSTSTPEPRPTPGAFDILSEPPAFIEVAPGTGAEAKLGQTVVVRYGAGKTSELPETFMVGATEVNPELESVVRGMKVGGKRKLGELEVELVKIL